MQEDIKLEVVSGQIPHVWYDIIGRIIPGAFLVVGLGAEKCFPGIASGFKEYMSGPNLATPFIGLLLFIAAAFISGFLLATLVFIPDFLWHRLWPLQLKELSPAAVNLLKHEFQVSNDDETKQSERISRASSSALHILWTYPTALPIAQLASKRYGEKLASGSPIWAALILIVCSLVLKEPWAYLLLLLSILATSLSAHHHYFRRVVETTLDALAEIRRSTRDSSRSKFE